MNMKKIAAGVTLAALLALPGLSAGASDPSVQPRLIPLTDFFRNPETTGYSLSPDGEHIAYMKPWENRLNVYVRKVGEQAETRLTDARERDIAGSVWANNNRIVYIQDTGGDENYRLYAVNIDGSGFKELTPFEGVQAGIVDRLEDNDDEMLISLNQRDPKVFDVYRINVNTGEMELIGRKPGQRLRVADRQRRPAAGGRHHRRRAIEPALPRDRKRPLPHRGDHGFQEQPRPALLQLRQPAALRGLQHRPRQDGHLSVRRQDGQVSGPRSTSTPRWT